MIKLNKLKRKFSEKEKEPVKILKSSMIASQNFADGKSLPLFFLETKNREDIEKLIEDYNKLDSKNGKSKSFFSKKTIFNTDFLYLILVFIDPLKCNIIIEFNLEKESFSLDLLIRNQGCYITSGKNIEELSDRYNRPKILVEVPTEHIRETWDKIFLNHSIRLFKKKGVSNRKAREMAEQYINEARTIDFQW